MMTVKSEAEKIKYCCAFFKNKIVYSRKLCISKKFIIKYSCRGTGHKSEKNKAEKQVGMLKKENV